MNKRTFTLFWVGLKGVIREEFATAVHEHLCKQRVSIMLDGSIIAFIKAKAGERGYQTLINLALHQAMMGGRKIKGKSKGHLLCFLDLAA